MCPPPHCRVRPAMSPGHITYVIRRVRCGGFHGRITFVMCNSPFKGNGIKRQRATGGTGGRHLRPTAERPATRPPCWPCPGRAVCREINGISGPSPPTLQGGPGLRQSRAAPLRGPPPPPIPPSGGAAWAASACAAPAQSRAGLRRVPIRPHIQNPCRKSAKPAGVFLACRGDKSQRLACINCGPREQCGEVYPQRLTW